MIHGGHCGVYLPMPAITDKLHFAATATALKASLVLIGGVLLSVCTGVAMALEKPAYTVEAEHNGIEYRRYESYLVAQTRVEGVADYNAAANEGFQRLFRYITGDNQVAGKIDMTAPVQQFSEDGGWLISFMLPSRYTLADAPPPADHRVELLEVKGRLMAATRYSGRWTAKNFDRHLQSMMDALVSEGVDPAGAAVSAVYDPPFMPPFLRRNEILVPVDRIPDSVGLP